MLGVFLMVGYIIFGNKMWMCSLMKSDEGLDMMVRVYIFYVIIGFMLVSY